MGQSQSSLSSEPSIQSDVIRESEAESVGSAIPNESPPLEVIEPLPYSYWGDVEDDNEEPLEDDFYPIAARRVEWMSSSIESLILGHISRAPLLDGNAANNNHEEFLYRRRSTASTFGGSRRGSLSFGGYRRGSLSASGPVYGQRRNSILSQSTAGLGTVSGSLPMDSSSTNVIYSLLARESTGKTIIRRNQPQTANLLFMSGRSLFERADAHGMASLVGGLATAQAAGDWAEVSSFVRQCLPRLVGGQPQVPGPTQQPVDPVVLMEREAFVAAGGTQLLMKMFLEKSFIGLSASNSHDAREASQVDTRLAPTWNEALLCLRELVMSMPQRVVPILKKELPFFMTLMAHDACFDLAVALVEEILGVEPSFFLGQVSNLYEWWRGFSCRQLAHFCRILALVIFEPEDRQLLESPKILKSQSLLQLRRNRAANRDATVDLNQALLLGDEVILERLCQLLKVLNYGPACSVTHILTRYPFIPDTLVMLGVTELSDFSQVERQLNLTRSNEGYPCRQGRVMGMLQSLYESLEANNSNDQQLSLIIHTISAAQDAGLIDPAPRMNRSSVTDMMVPLGQPVLTGQQAANSLQFNAIMLGAFQVEILFVLCTLLGSRRKLDAQEALQRLNVVPILRDLMVRLPWWTDDPDNGEIVNSHGQQQHHHSHSDGEGVEGIHGPGCECTPESALCVQYLRLLHNFCDRDCDNYSGRRILLSDDERRFIFEDDMPPSQTPGLLTLTIKAFCRESDESPYRFWLASCIESFLRGSSSREQEFVACLLLDHLVKDICSDCLHCSGSLQTSFDLLGEMIKGNSVVLEKLVEQLSDEEAFRKFMSIAASNLVDSNVFIRSTLLTLERNSSLPLFMGREESFISGSGNDSRHYLTHTWWDMTPLNLGNEKRMDMTPEAEYDRRRPSDWFPPPQAPLGHGVIPTGLPESVGHFGWVFRPADDFLSPNAYLPNTTERLSWFLSANQTRLLRDLLGVVDLRNINHENICCLNTAVVIAMFASRRNTLATILRDLRLRGEEELVDIMNHMSLQDERGRDVVHNFRQVLWFWLQYYMHRGRDRLSLEFSSHLHFQEWHQVVSRLVADDGSPSSLLSRPICLPHSPYQRAARAVIEQSRRRGA